MFTDAVTDTMTRVMNIPVNRIRSNPMQPRRIFNTQELLELSDSVKTFGILQPLSVREKDGYYELVMGERRYRAAVMAGLTEVPCIIREMQDEVAAVCAIIENIQRKDLNFFEEAEAIQRLITVYSLTQSELAQRLGRSQSSIANKLRLLRINPVMRNRIINTNLTERHARALLMLDSDMEREQVLNTILHDHLNVEKAEQVIKEATVSGKKKPIRKFIIKDIRLFWNSIDKAVSTVKQAGIKIAVKKRKREHYEVYTIRVLY